MCNINAIWAKQSDDKDRANVREIMNTISFNSYRQNEHGEGYIMQQGDNVTFHKSAYKVMYRDACELLISHQRFATSGTHDADMAHPFATDNLILVHNGILSCSIEGDHSKSDTFAYSQMLEANYAKYGGNIITAITETHRNLSGSFSIFVYDKNTKKMYYLKSDSTSFYVSNTKGYFIGSTLKENVEYALAFFDTSTRSIYTPKAFMLFDVFDGFRKVCKIPHPEPVKATWSGAAYWGYNQHAGAWADKWDWKDKARARAGDMVIPDRVGSKSSEGEVARVDELAQAEMNALYDSVRPLATRDCTGYSPREWD